MYDPLRAIGWSEARIQQWLATPSRACCGLSPSQLDAVTLAKAIGLVALVTHERIPVTA